MVTKQQEVGEAIKAAREERGMSRRKASKLAGVSEARLRQIENGVQYRDGMEMPAVSTPETLVRIAIAVGLEAAPVLELAGFNGGIAEHITPELPIGNQVGRVTTGSEGARFLSIGDLTDREVELVETFIAGLELGRKAG